MLSLDVEGITELIRERKSNARASSEATAIKFKRYRIVAELSSIGYEQCHHCFKDFKEHADGKCLYEPTCYLGEHWVTYTRIYPNGATEFSVDMESVLEELLKLQEMADNAGHGTTKNTR